MNVFDSDGSKFFDSDAEYTIKKEKNGKYSLFLNDIKDATIQIDSKDNLVYVHPSVNIEGEIFSLSISAKE